MRAVIYEHWTTEAYQETVKRTDDDSNVVSIRLSDGGVAIGYTDSSIDYIPWSQVKVVRDS